MMFELERLEESVGKGRTVGCQKWEFESFVSLLKVALEFPLCRGARKSADIPLVTTHPTEGLLDGMFARVSEAIVFFDTDDPSHMARCLQLQCQVTSAADCQGVERLCAESNKGNQRALWMITLTRDLDVLAPSVAASLTAILFAVSNIAKAWNVRAFLVFLVCHENSSELILF